MRRIRRHRVAGPQRLRRRASRDARAHHAPRPRARLHARRRGPQPRHPALAHHRRVHGDGRGSSGPAAPVLPRGARRAQAARRRRAASTCCCSPPSAPATATARTPTSSAPPPQRRRLRADGLDPEDAEVRRLVRADMPLRRRSTSSSRARAAEVVMSDNEAGAAAAVRHLHELGHRRIATITGLLDSRPGADRLRGYRAAMQDLGLAYRDELRRLRRLLRRERARATAEPARAPTSRRPRSSPRPT